MAAFIAAAAGACSPACAAAIASTPLSFPIITILGLATAAGYAISKSKINDSMSLNEEHETVECDNGISKTEVESDAGNGESTDFF